MVKLFKRKAEQLSIAELSEVEIEVSDEAKFAVEELEAFNLFGAADGKIARATANRRGFIAVYAGLNRRSLFGDIQKFSFWALPVDFALKLAGPVVDAHLSVEERGFMFWLCSRGKARYVKGVDVYIVDDENLQRDIKRQLACINGGC
ncbi:MAG: hypothetical protein NWF09_07465 [Candidatus Bathyarchaeota archaeon]|nr:hypothetical protein [Candidatus Bathyarchaeota archaeon]